MNIKTIQLDSWASTLALTPRLVKLHISCAHALIDPLHPANVQLPEPEKKHLFNFCPFLTFCMKIYHSNFFLFCFCFCTKAEWPF